MKIDEPTTYHASVEEECDLGILFGLPKKLPRKMKKAVKTMFYDCTERGSLGIILDPTPHTKWQCKVRGKCKPFEVMTPKGQIVTFRFLYNNPSKDGWDA